jgi:hypothetical protein
MSYKIAPPKNFLRITEDSTFIDKKRDRKIWYSYENTRRHIPNDSILIVTAVRA